MLPRSIRIEEYGAPDFINLTAAAIARNYFRIWMPVGEFSRGSSAEDPDWLEYRKNKCRPFMDEATERLLKAGITPEQVS